MSTVLSYAVKYAKQTSQSLALSQDNAIKGPRPPRPQCHPSVVSTLELKAGAH